MAYELNDLKGILYLVLFTIPMIVSTNVDCNGKAFHCVNSSHFMICVDLGGGVSTTIDDFVIPCPPTTVCNEHNIFECDFPKIEVITNPVNAIGFSMQSESVAPVINSLTASTFPTVTSHVLPLEKKTTSPSQEITYTPKLDVLESLKQHNYGTHGVYSTEVWQNEKSTEVTLNIQMISNSTVSPKDINNYGQINYYITSIVDNNNFTASDMETSIDKAVTTSLTDKHKSIDTMTSTGAHNYFNANASTSLFIDLLTSLNASFDNTANTINNMEMQNANESVTERYTKLKQNAISENFVNTNLKSTTPMVHNQSFQGNTYHEISDKNQNFEEPNAISEITATASILETNTKYITHDKIDLILEPKLSVNNSIKNIETTFIPRTTEEDIKYAINASTPNKLLNNEFPILLKDTDHTLKVNVSTDTQIKSAVTESLYQMSKNSTKPLTFPNIHAIHNSSIDLFIDEATESNLFSTSIIKQNLTASSSQTEANTAYKIEEVKVSESTIPFVNDSFANIKPGIAFSTYNFTPYNATSTSITDVSSGAHLEIDTSRDITQKIDTLINLDNFGNSENIMSYSEKTNQSVLNQQNEKNINLNNNLMKGQWNKVIQNDVVNKSRSNIGNVLATSSLYDVTETIVSESHDIVSSVLQSSNLTTNLLEKTAITESSFNLTENNLTSSPTLNNYIRRTTSQYSSDYINSTEFDFGNKSNIKNETTIPSVVGYTESPSFSTVKYNLIDNMSNKISNNVVKTEETSTHTVSSSENIVGIENNTIYTVGPDINIDKTIQIKSSNSENTESTKSFLFAATYKSESIKVMPVNKTINLSETTITEPSFNFTVSDFISPQEVRVNEKNKDNSSSNEKNTINTPVTASEFDPINKVNETMRLTLLKDKSIESSRLSVVSDKDESLKIMTTNETTNFLKTTMVTESPSDFLGKHLTNPPMADIEKQLTLINNENIESTTLSSFSDTHQNKSIKTSNLLEKITITESPSNLTENNLMSTLLLNDYTKRTTSQYTSDYISSTEFNFGNKSNTKVETTIPSVVGYTEPPSFSTVKYNFINISSTNSDNVIHSVSDAKNVVDGEKNINNSPSNWHNLADTYTVGPHNNIDKTIHIKSTNADNIESNIPFPSIVTHKNESTGIIETTSILEKITTTERPLNFTVNNFISQEVAVNESNVDYSPSNWKNIMNAPATVSTDDPIENVNKTMYIELINVKGIKGSKLSAVTDKDESLKVMSIIETTMSTQSPYDFTGNKLTSPPVNNIDYSPSNWKDSVVTAIFKPNPNEKIVKTMPLLSINTENVDSSPSSLFVVTHNDKISKIMPLNETTKTILEKTNITELPLNFTEKKIMSTLFLYDYNETTTSQYLSGSITTTGDDFKNKFKDASKIGSVVDNTESSSFSTVKYNFIDISNTNSNDVIKTEQANTHTVSDTENIVGIEKNTIYTVGPNINVDKTIYNMSNSENTESTILFSSATTHKNETIKIMPVIKTVSLSETTTITEPPLNFTVSYVMSPQKVRVNEGNKDSPFYGKNNINTPATVSEFDPTEKVNQTMRLTLLKDKSIESSRLSVTTDMDDSFKIMTTIETTNFLKKTMNTESLFDFPGKHLANPPATGIIENIPSNRTVATAIFNVNPNAKIANTMPLISINNNNIENTTSSSFVDTHQDKSIKTTNLLGKITITESPFNLTENNLIRTLLLRDYKTTKSQYSSDYITSTEFNLGNKLNIKGDRKNPSVVGNTESPLFSTVKYNFINISSTNSDNIIKTMKNSTLSENAEVIKDNKMLVNFSSPFNLKGNNVNNSTLISNMSLNQNKYSELSTTEVIEAQTDNYNNANSSIFLLETTPVPKLTDSAQVIITYSKTLEPLPSTNSEVLSTKSDTKLTLNQNSTTIYNNLQSFGDNSTDTEIHTGTELNSMVETIKINEDKTGNIGIKIISEVMLNQLINDSNNSVRTKKDVTNHENVISKFIAQEHTYNITEVTEKSMNIKIENEYSETKDNKDVGKNDMLKTNNPSAREESMSKTPVSQYYMDIQNKITSTNSPLVALIAQKYNDLITTAKDETAAFTINAPHVTDTESMTPHDGLQFKKRMPKENYSTNANSSETKQYSNFGNTSRNINEYNNTMSNLNLPQYLIRHNDSIDLKSTNHTITSEIRSDNEDKWRLTNVYNYNHTIINANKNLNTGHKDNITKNVVRASFDCLNRTHGKYADKNDCSKFYICVGKLQPLVGTCPNNTVFSEINKQCTRNLSHCVRNNQFRCLFEGRFSDFFIDNIYYICVKKGVNTFVRYKLQCENEYHLNKDSVKCERNIEKSSQSASSISENSKINSDISETKINFDENKRSASTYVFECEGEGKFPHLYDCRKYYVCSNVSKNKYRRKIKNCASEEVYDKKKQKCVEISDSGEC